MDVEQQLGFRVVRRGDIWQIQHLNEFGKTIRVRNVHESYLWETWSLLKRVASERTE